MLLFFLLFQQFKIVSRILVLFELQRFLIGLDRFIGLAHIGEAVAEVVQRLVFEPGIVDLLENLRGLFVLLLLVETVAEIVHCLRIFRTDLAVEL